MNFEPWRPGKTLIGFPDSSTGEPTLIRSMDQFFALAKESAALADLKIKLMLSGMMGIQIKAPHIGQINCRCAATPIPQPKQETHKFKVNTSNELHTQCSRCGFPGLYVFNPDGVYSCPICARRGSKP